MQRAARKRAMFIQLLFLFPERSKRETRLIVIAPRADFSRFPPSLPALPPLFSGKNCDELFGTAHESRACHDSCGAATFNILHQEKNKNK